MEVSIVNCKLRENILKFPIVAESVEYGDLVLFLDYNTGVRLSTFSTSSNKMFEKSSYCNKLDSCIDETKWKIPDEIEFTFTNNYEGAGKYKRLLKNNSSNVIAKSKKSNLIVLFFNISKGICLINDDIDNDIDDDFNKCEIEIGDIHSDWVSRDDATYWDYPEEITLKFKNF